MNPTSYTHTIRYALDNYTGADLDKRLRETCDAMDRAWSEEPSEYAYRQAVSGIADELRERASSAVKDGTISSDDDLREWVYETLHEEVDGNWWVIYHHAAARVCIYSRNDDAAWDVGIDLTDVQSLGQMHTLCAFWAMHADVMDEIDLDEWWSEMDPDSDDDA